MKTPNRDLLVLVKDDHLNKDAIEFELEQLNQLLLQFETIENLCGAHEVIDMNKYKVFNQNKVIREIISQRVLKSFVFLCNKN